MDKKEKDFLDRIKEQTEEIQVPESLRPENIEAKLKQQEKKKKKNNIYRYSGLLAACLVLAIGIFSIKNLTKKSDPETEMPKEQPVTVEGAKCAANYEEIYEKITENQEVEEQNNLVLFDTGREEADVASKSASDSARSTASENSADYSTTNVRQQNVDEGDVVKTDGKYLYVAELDGREISIVTTGNEMKVINTIKEADNMNVRELYLVPEEKKLVAIYSDNGNNTVAVTYDISNVEHMKKIGRVSQSGSYQSSRLTDGYLYLFSNYSVGYNITKDEPETYIPYVQKNLMQEDQIYLPPFGTGSRYTVMTSVDLKHPDQVKESKAFLSSNGELYVSEHYIFYYDERWGDGEQWTVIRSVEYKDGEMKRAQQGEIEGYIKDSFCIDEYKNYLRIVATIGDTNTVYVLNDRLEEVGAIRGLAKDERIYSARFMGDKAFFVTYRETDPLFSVDLTNPKKPKILGQLKIPGFSEYLHYYGDGKLLGIGMDADEETLETTGVKLSMFDISDPTDVTEENTYIIKNAYDSDAFYDYKSVMIDPEKDMIGFFGNKDGESDGFIFGYDKENGFTEKFCEKVNGDYGINRMVYVGDILYVINGNVIESYGLKDYKKIDDLVI